MEGGRVVDTMDLIKAIEEYPFLWNINHNDFTNKHKRVKAWHAIAARLAGDDWLDLRGSAQTLFVNTLQKRWKNVKDTYTKHLKLKNNKRPYVHEEALKFLQFSRRDEQGSNILDEYDESSEDYSNVNIKQEIEVVDNPINHDESSSNDTKSPSDTEQSFDQIKGTLIKDYIVKKVVRDRKKIIRPVKRMRQDTMEREAVQPDRDPEDDPDKLFLLSMLPLFKKLDEEKKMTARIQLTQVLQKLLFPEQ